MSESKRKKSKSSKRLPLQLDQVVNYFAACGRCSFFLAGYRVLHGLEDLETAVARSKSRWLKLTWSYGMRDLLMRSYGVQMYVDYDRVDGRCPECGRHFIYEIEPELEPEPAAEFVAGVETEAVESSEETDIRMEPERPVTFRVKLNNPR